MMPAIEICSTEKFDFKSKEYRALLRQSRVTAFQQPEWLTAFYLYVVKSDDFDPLIILIRTVSSGALLAVIPLIKRRVGNTVLVEYPSCGVTDYACPIVDSEFVAQATPDASQREQILGCLGSHDLFHVHPVRSCDVILWQTLLPVSTYALEFGRHDVNYSPNFQGSRSSNLSLQRQRQLDRKKRRLGDIGDLRLCLMDSDEAVEALNWVRNYREGRFEGDPIQNVGILNFYQNIVACGTSNGFARTYQLRCSEKPVSVCFGIVDENRFCYLLLACDYNNFGKHSPGIVMLDLVMKDWAAEGGQVFDFTIGDEAYKSYFHCQRLPLFGLTVTRTKKGEEYSQGLGLSQ